MNEMASAQNAGTGPSDGHRSADQAMADWVQDIAPYGIFTTDADLKITSWNQWLVTHSGFAMDEVLGRKLVEVYPEIEARHLSERFSRALAGEISVLSTALHKHLLPLPVTVPDTGLSHMLQTVRIAPLSQRGAIVGTITIIEDVTQREFQASILYRQQELDRLLSSALASLLQANDPSEEMSGIFATIAPALKLDVHLSYLPDPSGKRLRIHSWTGLSPKQRETISVLELSEADEAQLRAGGPPDVFTLGAHVESLRGFGLKGICCIPLTVGERIIGLVSFGSYQRDSIPPGDSNVLLRITRYVAIALDRSIRQRDTLAASRAKDDFLAALSHELRTPLNPVLLLASDSAVNPDYPIAAREAFRSIEKNALLEARLIDDLLDLTRIEHGKLSLEMLAFDVHGALKDALATVEPDAVDRRITLHVYLRSPVGMLTGDSARLQQVFWNVLKNAVKFTPVGGEIWTSTRLEAATNEIVIEIRDTGIGMEATEVARVFGAFSQGDHADQKSSHRFGGLGLGLAISRKLVELHSGRIEATSAGKNQGSTFTIYLPLLPATHQVPRTGHSGGDGNVAPSEAVYVPSVRRILLVEDHEPTRVPLARLLTRRGYEVQMAATCGTALEEASKGRFDLVLSDIGLPDGDGFELMRKLRDLYGLKGIALTGYGMEEDVLRSGKSGFVAHLTKPISVVVLDRALADVLPILPIE
jgi:PAS domain S-box-containing protein